MHSQGTLRYAAEGLESSGRVLRQMARRAAMNKCTLYAVIAIMLFLILMVLWGGGGADGEKAAPAAASAGGSWQRAPGR